MKSIITITGDIGSGKSTIARALEARLGYKAITTGAIQREIAARRGLTSLQLNELSAKDAAVDNTIDSYLKQLNDTAAELVLDSRLAWHFVAGAYNVYVSVDPRVGAERVLAHKRSQEVHVDVNDAMRNNLQRRHLENTRFEDLYGVHGDDPRNFDLTVDSTWTDAECIASLLIQAYRGRTTSHPDGRAQICPKSLYPTKDICDLDSPGSEDILASMRKNGYDPSAPVEAVRFSNYYFIHDGHKRTSCALRLGISHIPVILHLASEESAAKGLLYREEISAALTRPWIHDWEAALKFRFPSYPDPTGYPRFDQP